MATDAIQVAHATNPTFGMRRDDCPEPVYPGDFTTVAIVEAPPGAGDTEMLEWAFQRTNHIDYEWWENTDVTLVGEPRHRSTSVGDVVVLPDGRKFLCASAGWTAL